jgi:hypothetical protein
MDHEKGQQFFPSTEQPTPPPAERRTERPDRRVGPSDRRNEMRYGRRYGRKEDRRINFVKDRRRRAD